MEQDEEKKLITMFQEILESSFGYTILKKGITPILQKLGVGELEEIHEADVHRATNVIGKIAILYKFAKECDEALQQQQEELGELAKLTNEEYTPIKVKSLAHEEVLKKILQFLCPRGIERIYYKRNTRAERYGDSILKILLESIRLETQAEEPTFRGLKVVPRGDNKDLE